MEQFAAAYAVMARHLGLASRVTIAFTPGAATVTTRDALAYPEVWLEGAGWVPFYPVPLPGTSSQEQDLLGGVGAPPDRVDLQDVTSPSQPQDPDADAELEESPDERGLLAQVLLGLGAAVVAAALWLAVVAVWRVLALRRRRSTGSSTERVLGAWQQVLAALEAAGIGRVGTLTSEQVVERGRLVVEPETVPALAGVAGLARRSLFSPHPAGPDDVTSAWQQAEAVVRSARRSRGRISRLLDLAVPPRR